MGTRSQLAVKAEAEYGTAVVPDRFVPFLSESLSNDPQTYESDALRAAGRGLRRSDDRIRTGRGAGGDITIEGRLKGLGIWLEHLLGGKATAANGTSGFDHTFTLGSIAGKSLTIQKGVERHDETVEPLNFVGCKIASTQFSLSRGGVLQLQISVDARDAIDAPPALQVASFAADNPPRTYAQGLLEIDDVALAKCISAQWTITNPLEDDTQFLGGAGLKDEPRSDGYPTITGELEVKFVSKAALYDAYDADTPLKLDLSLTGDVEIDATEGNFPALTLAVPEIRLNGSTPQVSGPQVPTMRVPFAGYFDGVSEDLTMVLTNTDATP